MGKKKILSVIMAVIQTVLMAALPEVYAQTEQNTLYFTDFSLTSDEGVQLNGEKIEAWTDLNTGMSFETADGYSQPVYKDGAVTFGQNDLLKCSPEYRGAQTMFAVVRSDNLNTEQSFIYNAIRQDSTAITEETVIQSNKITGFIPSNDYFVFAVRKSVENGKILLSSWVNESKETANVECSDFGDITSICGGGFSLKNLTVYCRAMTDIEIYAKIKELKSLYAVGGKVIVSGMSFLETEGEVSISLTLLNTVKNSEKSSIFCAVRNENGTIVSIKGQRTDLTDSGEKTVNILFERDIIDSASLLNIYIWDEETIIPLTSKTGTSVWDISRIEPSSSKEPETEGQIPEYQSTIPDKSEMRLKISEYGDPNADYLYAKGFLDGDYVYNPNMPVSKDVFSRILSLTTGVDQEYGAELTRAEAVSLMYSGLRQRRKAYSRECDLPYEDIQSLSEEEIKALKICFLSGAVENNNIFRPQDILTQQEAFEWLTKLIVNESLFDADAGTSMEYTIYAAKYACTNACRLKSEQMYTVDNVAYEAMEKECITIKSIGDYIRFENAPESNRISIRYNLPKPSKAFDSSGTCLPSDDMGTVNLYVNGQFRQTLLLHSLALYTAVDNNGYKKLFTEITAEENINEGDTVELRLDADNEIPSADDFTDGLSVDSIRFVSVPSVIGNPGGYVDITGCGAIPDDDTDDTLAIVSAVEKAYLNGTGVYIPPGKYLTGRKIALPSGIKIAGAGMYYSTLECTADNTALRGGRTGFTVDGDNIEISGIKITSSQNYRRVSTVGSAVNGKGRNISIHDVWLERCATGIWAEMYDTEISSCLITDCFADGVHMTGPSQNITVENCLIIGCGDDGIAATSTPAGKSVVSGFFIRNNTILAAYGGRGIMVSGTAECVIENNYIADIFRNPAVLVWDERVYNTMSVYNTEIRNNIVSRSIRNTGLHRGSITVHSNRLGYYTDADVYDNESYHNKFSYGLYTADFKDTDTGETERVYCEMDNNIVHMTADTDFYCTESSIKDSNSVVVNGTIFELKF